MPPNVEAVVQLEDRGQNPGLVDLFHAVVLEVGGTGLRGVVGIRAVPHAEQRAGRRHNMFDKGVLPTLPEEYVALVRALKRLVDRLLH